MFEIGTDVLVVLPHGYVVCGCVGEQVGIDSWKLHKASIISATNGVAWEQLAEGHGHSRATFRPWGDVIVHSPIMVRIWKGGLP